LCKTEAIWVSYLCSDALAFDNPRVQLRSCHSKTLSGCPCNCFRFLYDFLVRAIATVGSNAGQIRLPPFRRLRNFFLWLISGYSWSGFTNSSATVLSYLSFSMGVTKTVPSPRPMSDRSLRPVVLTLVGLHCINPTEANLLLAATAPNRNCVSVCDFHNRPTFVGRDSRFEECCRLAFP